MVHFKVGIGSSDRGCLVVVMVAMCPKDLGYFSFILSCLVLFCFFFFFFFWIKVAHEMLAY